MGREGQEASMVGLGDAEKTKKGKRKPIEGVSEDRWPGRNTETVSGKLGISSERLRPCQN